MIPISTEKYTENLVGAFGTFYTDNKTPVFYINSTIPIDQINKLKPVRDILEIAEVDFDELVQRDLDDSRIKSEISQYLITEKGYKFFPPIVNAFVQPSEDNRSIKKSYPKIQAVEVTEGEYTKLVIEFKDAFTVKWFVDSSNNVIEAPVEVRWKPQTTDLMTVDGQHRLIALKAVRGLLTTDEEKAFYQSLKTSKLLDNVNVPITVLFFPNTSYESDIKTLTILNKYFPAVDWEDKAKIDVKTILRSIFVDINKNARTPSESRNILLNERDLCAIFTRQIFSDIKKQDQNIFPHLLDYNSPKSKEYQIDRNRPIITTIGIVYKICEYLFKDSAGDKRKIEDGEKLREKLNIHLQTINEKEIKKSEISAYNFTFEQRKDLNNIFKNTWHNAFKALYVDFFPYRKLKEAMEDEYKTYKKMLDKDTLSADDYKMYSILFGGSEKRFFLERNGKSDKTDELSVKYRMQWSQIISKEKEIRSKVGEFQIFYSQMFQKGFFEMLNDLVSIKNNNEKEAFFKFEEIRNLIEVINTYLKLNEGQKSIFSFDNSTNRLLFKEKNDPKKSSLISNILTLSVINYDNTESQNNKFISLELFDDVKLKSLTNSALENIKKKIKESIKNNFENLTDVKLLNAEIDNYNEQNEEGDAERVKSELDRRQEEYVQKEFEKIITEFNDNLRIKE